MTSVLLLIGSNECINCSLLSIVSNIIYQKTHSFLFDIIEIEAKELSENTHYKRLNLSRFVKWTPNLILINSFAFFNYKPLEISDIKVYCSDSDLNFPTKFSLESEKIIDWINNNYKRFKKANLNLLI